MDIEDPKIDPRLVPEGSRPIIFGATQPQYQPLPAIITPTGCMISRWKPSVTERKQLSAGEDIYIAIWNSGHVNPMFVSIGTVDWKRFE